jgi:hypothetical protein
LPASVAPAEMQRLAQVAAQPARQPAVLVLAVQTSAK